MEVIMPRIRLEKNREWSIDKKLEIIKKVIDDGESATEVAKDYDVSGGLVRGWVIAYNKFGIDGIKNKRKPGNPLAKYSNRKELNKIEQLEYENFKY